MSHRRGSLLAPVIQAIALVVVALFGLIWNGLSEASVQTGQLQINSVVTDNWPHVEATVTVLDASGEPVSGLPAESFSASIDGDPVTVGSIATASDSSIGIAVVLVFDLSGSMAGEPLAEAKVAGKALLGQLGAQDQASIMSFSDEPAVVQGFTADRVVLEQAIDSLEAGGNTALYAAVQQSAVQVQQAPLTRRAVVLMSDGVDFGVAATASRESSLAIAGQSNATFMAVGLGPAIDSEYLSQLATLGEGQFLAAPAAADLEELFRTVGDILRQQYVLTIDAGNVGSQFSSGALRVEANVGGNLIVGERAIRLPAGLQPTTSPSPAATTPRATGTSPPTSAATGSEESSNGRGTLVAAMLVAAVAVLVVGAGSLLYARTNRRQEPTGDGPEPRRFDAPPEMRDFPAIARAVPAFEESGAWLELSDGSRYALTNEPVTLGFTPDCAITLPNGTPDRMERGRIWRRDGSYMLHNLSRLGGISVAGRPVTWVILEDGDEIAVGPARVTFREPADIAKI